MDHVRAVLLHPAEMTTDAMLNRHGVQQLIEQEGIPLAVTTPGEVSGFDLAAGDVLVAAECESFSTREEEAIVALADDLPLVWCGLPREDASPELLAMLGISDAEYSRDGLLRRLSLQDHAVTRGLGREHEARLKLKHVAHLGGQTRIEGCEAMTISLMDGTKLGPGLVLADERPRRAVFAFPLGLFFAVTTGRHIDIRRDAEWLDWPVMAYIDVLRRVLRECLRWAAPEASLVRTRYWPTVDGEHPAGVMSLTHDLCGYSEAGVRWICEVCEEYGVPTTFFDMPPIRLDAGEVGDHCIALHVSDDTPQEAIDEGLRELRERHGREIIGWRRHGATRIESYPDIWRRIRGAGIEWSNTWPTQSHPNRATCSPCGVACRLPYDIMDLETGERLDLLELPIFDTDDADRLAAIAYGMRLTWEQFAEVVERRLDHAAKHGGVAGYLLHGWTAGAATEAGRNAGAADARRMMTHIIEQARARGMAIMDGDEMYRWWTFRRNCRIEFGPDGPEIIRPDESREIELEVFPPLSTET